MPADDNMKRHVRFLVPEQELNNKRVKTAAVNMFQQRVAIFGPDQNESLRLLERTHKRFKERREGNVNLRVKNRSGEGLRTNQ